MVGKFKWTKFADCDLEDVFFKTLKSDYPEFPEWFNKKSLSGESAFIFRDEQGLGAFMYLKLENETISLSSGNLPAIPRVKIGTLKLSDRFQGQRLGEGALGVALWRWQKEKCDEIHVTVFEKHELLIAQLKKFGFWNAGSNVRGEQVYIKNRKNLDYSTPFSAFPFFPQNFKKGGYLIIDDHYHDILFPYSELKNVTTQEMAETDAANGITKIYIGSPRNVHIRRNEPILVYRKHTQKDGQKPFYKSTITSFCVATDVITVKHNGRELMTCNEFLARIGNKSVFEEKRLREKFSNEPFLTLIEMLYNGYFGAGNNVNCAWLTNNGYWGHDYPTNR